MFAGITKYGSFNSKPEPGNIMHFVYDAKGKDHLPVWDRFPLCIPFENAVGGFYGLNLHYAPIPIRHYILKGLTENAKRGDVGRIRANYNLIKGLSMYEDVKPTIKRYLLNHVQSRFLVIDEPHWGTVLNMPTEKWVVKKGGQKPERGEAPETDLEAHKQEVKGIKNWGKPEEKK